MSAIRPLTAAVILGTSVWCAAGQLTVIGPESPAVRLAVPASLWWWLLPACAALLVPAWRQRPSLAAPALVSTLPWWPVPVPAAFLIWTGPMAWVPIGVVGLLAVRPGSGRPAAARAPASGTGGGALLAGVLTFALGIATAVAIDTRTPGGDEPHYLIITQSLLNDGDLRIENNHTERQYAEYFGGTIAPDFIQRGADGEIYSIHAPGVSTLVLPAFAVFGYRGAQATLLGLSALTGALIWLIGWHATGRRDAAWFAWAGVTLTPTLLLQSSLIFPDGPGALVVAAAVWLIVRLARRAETVSPVAIFTAGTLLAALPWMHTRFSVLSAGFGLIIAALILAHRTDRARRLLTFSAVPVVSALAWFGLFWAIYGTVNPAAPYGTESGASFAYVPGGTLALLFDQQFGLLTYSPVLVAVVHGLAVARRSGLRAGAWSIAAVGAVYTTAVTTYWMWWAGVPATPARFLTAVIPAAALPLALAWASAGPRARGAWGGLLAASLAISAATVGVGQGSLAWNTRNAEAQWLEWLGPVANLPRAWPSFFWRLSPDDLSTELPFVWHVATFVLILLAGTWAGLRLRVSSGGRGLAAPALGLAWALPASLMAAATVGWALNGVSGLDPARSQLSVLADLGRGAGGWRIEPGAIARAVDITALRIHGDEPGRTDTPPPWMTLRDVPAGRYELDLSSVTAEGQLAVTIGRSPAPVAEATREAGGGRLSVPLPAGARLLVVDGGQRPGGEVVLRPVSPGVPVNPLARSYQSYGASEIFFLDDAVFVEASGFWVRGESTADWVIADRSGITRVSMLVQNGATDNVVDLTVNGRTESLTLAPSETRTVDVEMTGDVPMARVRLQSARGFRPSEAGPSEDRRYLGVWVSVR